MRPSFSARLTASRRLRTSSLRYSQHAYARPRYMMSLADIRHGFRTDEQVHQRQIDFVTRCAGNRLGATVRRVRALDPRLALEHDSKAPVHHVVIVYDQHPDRLREGRDLIHGPPSGTARRTCQIPGWRAPNSSNPPACSASSEAIRNPTPGSPGW